MGRLLGGLSNGWTILASAALVAACTAGFSLRAEALGGHETLDVQPGWYGPERAHALLAALTPRQREVYAWTELSLDLIYPLSYAGLFVGVIWRLSPRRIARVAVVFPVAMLLADYTENATGAYLAWTFEPGSIDPLARVTAAATWSKWRLLFPAGGAFIGSLLVGAASWLRRLLGCA